MSVKQTNRTAHSEPIYFVELLPTPAGTLLVTNTQSGRNQTGPDGFPVQYRQTINLNSGACTCQCAGFDSIAYRAQRAGITPTLANEKTCCHIRKAAQVGIEEWGYIADETPAALPEEKMTAVTTISEAVDNAMRKAFYAEPMPFIKDDAWLADDLRAMTVKTPTARDVTPGFELFAAARLMHSLACESGDAFSEEVSGDTAINMGVTLAALNVVRVCADELETALHEAIEREKKWAALRVAELEAVTFERTD